MFSKIYILANKVKTYGFMGVVTYLLTLRKRHAKRMTFIRNMRRFPCPQPQTGITLIGPLTFNSSLSKVLRDLAFALKDANISFQTFDTADKQSVPTSDVQDIITPREEFQLLKYTHIIDLMTDPLPVKIPRSHCRIAFWEFETGLLSVHPELASSIGVLGFSDFNAKIFRSSLPPATPVRKILYPFRQIPVDSRLTPTVREKYRMNVNDFIVFFNFDFASSANRKNPDGAIRAFGRAFKNTPDAKLVFKTMRAKMFPERMKQLQQLAQEVGISDRFICINTYVPQADLYGLTDACDVYLSLHRGEGFGLGIAEAMSLGKAVVVTNYSAPTEFCNPSNSIPIPYVLTRIPPEMNDHPLYASVTHWAEPDINAAADALKELYSNKALRRHLGEKAKTDIAEHFSSENFNKSINAFLYPHHSNFP